VGLSDKMQVVLLLCFAAVGFAQCPADPLTPGRHSQSMRSAIGGNVREYNIHIPRGYTNREELPLLITMHGYTDSPRGIEAYSGFSDYADSLNFVVVYPQGLDASWNAGRCCGTSASRGVHDFEWIGEEIIDDIAQYACIDRSRVYASGMSNGCMMSEGLACKYPDVFDGIACHSGCISLNGGNSECDRDFGATGSVSVFEVHGTQDNLVPVDGNIYCAGVYDTEEAWSDRLDCGTKTTYFEEGVYSCERYNNCKNGEQLEQCIQRGGYHTWFDDRDFSSSEFILQFCGLMPRASRNETVITLTR